MKMNGYPHEDFGIRWNPLALSLSAARLDFVTRAQLFGRFSLLLAQNRRRFIFLFRHLGGAWHSVFRHDYQLCFCYACV